MMARVVDSCGFHPDLDSGSSDWKTMRKTDRSLLALIPPESLWSPIEAIRTEHDHNQRWIPPHVTLLCPFVEQAAFEEILPVLAEACARVAPFVLRLERFSTFSHSGERTVVWLVPEPREPIAVLHDALLAVAPMCHEQASYPGGFTPHFTVGRVEGGAARDRFLHELRITWRPLQWQVDRVSLLYKPRRLPYGLAEELRLG